MALAHCIPSWNAIPAPAERFSFVPSWNEARPGRRPGRGVKQFVSVCETNVLFCFSPARGAAHRAGQLLVAL